MDVAGTVCIAEVYECGVDYLLFLAFIQQILQIAEVSVAAPDSVASTVLVQQEHLAGREPTLTTIVLLPNWSTTIGRGMLRLVSHWSRASHSDAGASNLMP